VAYQIQNIRHFVVLMMENRSFDHMLGFLRYDGHPHPINGLTGTESNPLNPSVPGSPRIAVSPDARPTQDLHVDPDHTLTGTNTQLFGNPAGTDTGVHNQGFVYSYRNLPGVTDAIQGNVMKAWDPQHLPVLTTLAREFAVCDAWFASVPAQTWPNRFFVHTATSDGRVDNRKGIDRPTIYDELDRKKLDWYIYFHTYPHAYTIRSILTSGRTGPIADFWTDAANGLLPRYCFLEPEYGPIPPNDQHPDHDVFRGESFIADVYEALRNSPDWDDTLLVVVYDEHGGLYDHVQSHPATPPDDKVYNDGTIRFGFDRYGVRVPAILVSPRIPAATVDSTVYDHTSIIATARLAFGIDTPLTRRDAAAGTFERNLSLDTIRDSPRYLPRPRSFRTTAPLPMPPLTDLQASLLEHAAEIAQDESCPVAARRVSRAYLERSAPALAFAASPHPISAARAFVSPGPTTLGLEYEAEYRNGSFRALCESGEELIFVAGSHNQNFLYFGDAPWDNVLLLIGRDRYQQTVRTPGLVQLQFDTELENSPGPAMIAISGTLQRSLGAAPVSVNLRIAGTVRGFSPRNEGLISEGGPGFMWHAFEFSSGSGEALIGSTRLAIVAASGQMEHGRVKNFKASAFAFYWDYLSVVQAPSWPYEYVRFQAHAIKQTGFGKLLESYLSKHAVAEVTSESGLETDGNPHGVVRPDNADSSVVIIENEVPLKLAILRRQLIRTTAGAGEELFGLREIFEPL
jgi:phospholipase C